MERRKAMNTIALITASPIRTAIVSDLKKHKSERYGVLKEHVENITGGQISPGSLTWHLEKLKGAGVIDKNVTTDQYYLTRYGEEVRETIDVATEQIRSIETMLKPLTVMREKMFKPTIETKGAIMTNIEINRLPLGEIQETLKNIAPVIAEIEAAIKDGKLDPSVRNLPLPEAIKKLQEFKEHKARTKK